MSFLKSIDLRYNSLSGFSSQNMYTNLPNLEELVLANNLFTGPVPHGFWKMRGIRKLILALNHFTGNIPPEVGNLTQMKWLYLERNMFTGKSIL
ncbi:putative non-specific serine/threonine protein kinase [Helianthus debilis subsp. tardiflorus]